MKKVGFPYGMLVALGGGIIELFLHGPTFLSHAIFALVLIDVGMVIIRRINDHELRLDRGDTVYAVVRGESLVLINATEVPHYTGEGEKVCALTPTWMMGEGENWERLYGPLKTIVEPSLTAVGS